MKLLTGKKYNLLHQNCCERVLRMPKRVGLMLCALFTFFFIEVKAQSVLQITCPSPNTQTICIGNVTVYTHYGTAWDATATTDCGTSSTVAITYSTDNGVTPSNGGATLNGAAFSVGSHTITWTATDQCGSIQTCTETIVIGNSSSYPNFIAGGLSNTTQVSACVGYNPSLTLSVNSPAPSGGSGSYSYQ